MGALTDEMKGSVVTLIVITERAVPCYVESTRKLLLSGGADLGQLRRLSSVGKFGSPSLGLCRLGCSPDPRFEGRAGERRSSKSRYDDVRRRRGVVGVVGEDAVAVWSLGGHDGQVGIAFPGYHAVGNAYSQAVEGSDMSH